MRTIRTAIVPVTALATALGGCAASRPMVYLGEQPNAEGQAKAEQDVAACLEIGKRYGSASDAGAAGAEAARGAAVGGAVGAAGGAAGGAVVGHAGTGAAAGAAWGAASGLMWRLLRRPAPDPVYRAAVERCLADRGHRVLAWK